MGAETLCYLSLHDLSGRIRRGDVSPVEAVEAFLQRIEQLNPRLSAFLTLCADRALEEAKRAGAEIAAGRWRGPLHGVPYGVKDIIETAGVRTTNGSSFSGTMCRLRTPSASRACAGRAPSCSARRLPTNSQRPRPPSIPISGPRGIPGSSTASRADRAGGPQRPSRRGCARSLSARIREDPSEIPLPSAASWASSQHTDGRASSASARTCRPSITWAP